MQSLQKGTWTSFQEKWAIKSTLKCLPWGTPLLLGSLDEMVQWYLLATRNKGGLISSAITIATSKPLIARYPEYNLGHIDLDSPSWAKNSFKRMGFAKWISTTGKIEIPEGAKNETQLVYLHDTVTIAEEQKVPSCLILNLD